MNAAIKIENHGARMSARTRRAAEMISRAARLRDAVLELSAVAEALVVDAEALVAGERCPRCREPMTAPAVVGGELACLACHEGGR